MRHIIVVEMPSPETLLEVWLSKTIKNAHSQEECDML